MSEQERNLVEQKTNIVKPASREKEHQQETQKLPRILQKLGNRNIQRILQRSSNEPQPLDDETKNRINSERGDGAPLDSRLQMQMSEQMGFDISGVRVHNSASSDQLNRQLDAKAFTTGQDIFFRSGEYNPGTNGGKELLTHELTHVVQQGTGQVQNSGGMTVNAPGDRFEQEADRMATSLTNNSPTTQTNAVAQRNGTPEEEEITQTKRNEGTWSFLNQLPALQTQEDEEEEEKVQTKSNDLSAAEEKEV